jgi:hypothetical protein
MRAGITLFVVLSCTGLPSIGRAGVPTANDLLQKCAMLERTLEIAGDGSFSFSTAPGAQECWGFFEAVHSAAMARGISGRAILGACVPGVVTTTQIIQVFTAYARNHPAQLHEEAFLVAARALQASFPCR